MTQIDTIKKQIDETGQISRNWCLDIRITRLGSYIVQLNKKGYNLKGGYVNGDYIYMNETIIDEETSTSELNAKLRDILARSPWVSRSKYLLLGQAIESKDNSLKKGVIKEYA